VMNLAGSKLARRAVEGEREEGDQLALFELLNCLSEMPGITCFPYLLPCIC
jgi:hypothetical protein